MAAMITTATTSVRGVTLEVEAVPPSMVAKLLGQTVGERVVVDVLGRTLQLPRTYMLEVRCSCSGVDVVAARTLEKIGRRCSRCRHAPKADRAGERRRKARACARPKAFWESDSLQARLEEWAIAQVLDPQTRVEIGDLIGVSRQRIEQIEARALRKLRSGAMGWEP